MAVYCLLIGFEMLLKAYLIFLNKKYCKHAPLIGLGHDFNRIFKALTEEKSTHFLKEIEEIMKEYELFEINIDTMRYPKKGDAYWMSDGYYKVPNEFDFLFDNVGGEINREIMQSFYKR